jgi:2-oxoglutarate ferredoxin oxidoreductase subunit beta
MDFNRHAEDVAWCPGCGNFKILDIVNMALSELGKTPGNTVVVSGIGQAAKMPQYLNVNMFNGLHGRALPAATAIKAVNPSLSVIAEGGDGDMYGEGGNHFIHCIRRNPDITHLVHNNMVYGLTKGQASPTSLRGFTTPVQVEGVSAEPFNPLAVAIALNASFVARAFCGDVEQTKEIVKKAMLHKGYALVDIFQQCVSFNKVNTYKWYKDSTYYIDDSHDPQDRLKAFDLAIKNDKYPLGVFYINEKKQPFPEALKAYQKSPAPLYTRQLDRDALYSMIEKKRR